MQIAVFVGFLLVSGASIRVEAQTWSATHPGYPCTDARALGMGTAIVSSTDGPTALAWNPAGLVEQVFPEIAGDLGSTSLRSSALFFGSPVSQDGAIGLGWVRNRRILPYPGTPEGLDRFAAGVGIRLTDKLAVGMSGSFLSPQYRAAPDSAREAAGFSTDIGALFSLTGRIRARASIYDLTDAKVWREDGRVETLNPRSVRWGVSFDASDQVTFAYQRDQGDRIGVEWFPVESMALRGGVGHRDRMWSRSGGVGFRSGSVRVDYAYAQLEQSYHQHRVSVAMVFPRGRSAVQITKPQVRSLYASLGKAYTREPVASIELVNSSSTPVTTRVELLLPRFMTAPSSEEVTLRPYSRQRIFLRAVLSGEQIAAVADQPVQGVISLVNPATGEVWRRHTVDTFLYRRGALTWDDVRKASAFVTPADPDVRAFVRESLRPYRSRLQQLPLTQEIITTAMVLFEAAGEVGITYQSDPNTPFSEVRKTENPLDAMRRIGMNTLTLAVKPVEIAANPIRNVISGPDSARGDTLGVIGNAVSGVSGMITGVGEIGEESLRLLLFPYQALAGDLNQNPVVDDILYPAELLRVRAGDCDDTTVLLCSLLECAGLTTAFVEAPDHIFMMVDTRLPVGESPYVLPAPVERFVAFEGTWWLPLETTLFPQGFMAAWSNAAGVARSLASQGNLRVTRVAEGWALFEPIEFHASPDEEIRFPDSRNLERRVSLQGSALAVLWKDSPVVRDLLASVGASTGGSEEDKRRADAAFWLLFAGRLSDADQHLRVLEEHAYDPPRVLGLRAVYWFFSGDVIRAQEFADQACEAAPEIPDLLDLRTQIRAARSAVSE